MTPRPAGLGLMVVAGLGSLVFAGCGSSATAPGGGGEAGGSRATAASGAGAALGLPQSSAASTFPDPCSLVIKEQAGQAMGATIAVDPTAESLGGFKVCTYTSEGGGHVYVTAGPGLAARGALQSAESTQPVSGVGDEAVFAVIGSGGELYVRKGGVGIDIEVDLPSGDAASTKAAEITLAQAALPKL